MGATEVRSKLYSTVETGPGCSLNGANGRPARFSRVLIPATEAFPSNALLLYEEGNVRNLHTEAVAEVADYNMIDSAFADCPCMDPENAGLDLGRAGCLAIKALKQE